MNSVQSIKDTFFTVLRDRIAAANSGRTTVVRGALRTALVVAENELPSSALPTDRFSLRWLGRAVDASGLVRLGCELQYGTEGSAGAGGMDRGRALAAMDAELEAAVNTAPQTVAGLNAQEAGGITTETPTGGRIFWSDAAFGPAVIRGPRMERTATVEVFGYE